MIVLVTFIAGVSLITGRPSRKFLGNTCTGVVTRSGVVSFTGGRAPAGSVICCKDFALYPSAKRGSSLSNALAICFCSGKIVGMSKRCCVPVRSSGRKARNCLLPIKRGLRGIHTMSLLRGGARVGCLITLRGNGAEV